MKRTVLIIALTLAVGPARTLASSCPTAALNVYTASGFSCQVGGDTFSNFTYGLTQSGGATGPTASLINVVPLNVVNDPGFQFQGGWFVGSGQSIDSLVTFLVTAPGGAQVIEDASLVQTGGFFGTGVSLIDETLCLQNTSNCTGNITQLNTVDSKQWVQLNANVDFTPTGQLLAKKDIQLIGGTLGQASISAIQDQFSQVVVPEPGTLTLLGTGLLTVAGIVRRKLKA